MKFLQLLIGAGAAIFLIAVSYFLFSLGPVSESSFLKSTIVAGGEGFSEISEKLESAGLVRSKWTFRFYAVLTGSAHNLKPGNYLLNAASSTPEILGVLVFGPIREETVVIPEGMSLKDIEKKLSDSGIAAKGAIQKISVNQLKADYVFLEKAETLEGYLFPDTYRFFSAGGGSSSGGKNSDPEIIIRKFLDNFRNKAWPIIELCRNSENSCGGLNDYQILTLASLLEKEAPLSADRRIIAGILAERLSVGAPLQVDATLYYIKCGGFFVYCDHSGVAKIDLKLSSRYNTYLFRGLPPGPIGNPGREAIWAAVNPEKSDYWYYLSDPKTGKTVFSKTLDEHNENRSKYLGI